MTSFKPIQFCMLNIIMVTLWYPKILVLKSMMSRLSNAVSDTFFGFPNSVFFFFFKLKKKDWIHGCQEKNRIFCGRVLVWIRGLHAPAHLSATSHVSCLWCYFLTQSLQDITLRPTDAKQTYRQTQNRPTEGQSD